MSKRKTIIRTTVGHKSFVRWFVEKKTIMTDIVVRTRFMRRMEVDA